MMSSEQAHSTYTSWENANALLLALLAGLETAFTSSFFSSAGFSFLGASLLLLT
jgi:hypothetical protein